MDVLNKLALQLDDPSVVVIVTRKPVRLPTLSNRGRVSRFACMSNQDPVPAAAVDRAAGSQVADEAVADDEQSLSLGELDATSAWSTTATGSISVPAAEETSSGIGTIMPATTALRGMRTRCAHPPSRTFSGEPLSRRAPRPCGPIPFPAEPPLLLRSAKLVGQQ